ncbi:hypothetical protein RHMOL_Rhmol01G0162700 [Rhododendron molle]|uniref:Uncharacterized protein n=1 Tax=Rhododendron molle TaxID=49168 RepID=A0ACC0Q5D3_RHOML|nr:hypothetical protein RHMOL_Rhmol01G0162700 [Rhododendron molle]
MRKAHKVANLHHFHFEIFNSVIDMQVIELDARFPESTTDLLLYVACLNPSNLFSSFDKKKLIHMAELYPQDFSSMDLMILDDQLDNYIVDVRTTIEFSSLHGISDLAQKMVEIGRHRAYPLVYLLIVLALTLPVATATIERAFSAMNYVKNQWRNRMGDEWTSDSMVAYIEGKITGRLCGPDLITTFMVSSLQITKTWHLQTISPIHDEPHPPLSRVSLLPFSPLCSPHSEDCCLLLPSRANLVPQLPPSHLFESSTPETLPSIVHASNIAIPSSSG